MAAKGIATSRRYNVSAKRRSARISELLRQGVPVQQAVEQAKGPAEELPQRSTGAVTGATFDVANELRQRDYFEDHPVDKAKLLDAKVRGIELDKQIAATSDAEVLKGLQLERDRVTTAIVALQQKADDAYGVSSPRSKEFGAGGQITEGPKYRDAIEAARAYQEKAAKRTARLQAARKAEEMQRESAANIKSEAELAESVLTGKEDEENVR